MYFFYSELNSGTFTRRHDVEELFDHIKQQHEADPVKLRLNLQHGSLKPRLRDYQKLAVWWMLTKERYGQEWDGSGMGTEILSPALFYGTHTIT